MLLITTCLPLYAQAQDGTVFKSDVPKLDTSIQKQTLKGGIQHTESAPPPPPARKLSAGANSGNSKLSAATAKTDLLHKLFKSKVSNQAPLTAQVQSSIGIIGVRFVLGFGRPPIINRVFPGTPAQQSGLRINDIIVAVDGVPTAGLTKEEVYAMIVGAPETPVTVSVVRNGDFIARTMNRMDFNDIPDPMVKRDYLMSM